MRSILKNTTSMNKQATAISERERERERVINNNVGLKPTLIMLFALLAVVGTILAVGFQNIASATPEQVNFNPVTIRNGSKIHVNGDKTLTAIDSGNKLVADNTNGTAVKGNQIESELNSFATNNYGDDALFKANTASNPKSLGEAELNAFRNFLPTVSSDYWLSDTGSSGSVTWQSYANGDNKLEDNTLVVSGKIDNNEFDNDEVAKGSVAFNKDLTLSNYTASAGGVWYDRNYGVYDTVPTYTVSFYQTSKWLNVGDTVYNNIYLRDDPSSSYFSYFGTNIRVLGSGHGERVCAYVSGNKIYQVRPGQTLKKGTTLVVLLDSSDGLGDRNVGEFSASDGRFTTGFSRLDKDITVGRYLSQGILCGVSRFYTSATPVTAKSIVSGTFNVRPVYDINSNRIAFIRSNTSSNSLTTSPKFGDVPQSSAVGRENYKLVVPSTEVKINNAFDTSRVSTEKSSSGHRDTEYSNNTIKVPYGSNSLKINKDALTTENVDYISALANCNGIKKYATLATIGSDFEIDLGSIINTNKIGNRVSVSFYGEKVNNANYTDCISENPVSVSIEVVEGAEQTIRYDTNGGAGSVPSQNVVKAGNSINLAGGFGLNKNGSVFTCWEVKYVPYGQHDQVSKIVRPSEPFIVPDTADGSIIASAIYGGSVSKKSTDTKPTVYTVSWDSNAPVGYTTRFTSSDATYNDDMTVRYDKVKDIKANKITIPGAPDIDVTGKELRVFEGWFTEKIGGERLTSVEIEVTENVTYYAHWTTSYIITFDATDGVFADGSTQKDVKVTPGSSIGSGFIIEKPTNGDMGFTGWYTEKSGLGTRIKEDYIPDHSFTVYAAWVGVTFFGPATTDVSAEPNPRMLEGEKFGLDFVNGAAKDISAKGSSSDYYARFTAWMRNDNYHLYTLLKDTSTGKYMDADVADNWVEFRILQVGQHNSDGSGLTFGSIHAMPQSERLHSSSIVPSNWASSALYSKVNSTSYYNQFDSQLISLMLNLTTPSRKGKLWAPSPTEVFLNPAYASGKYYPSDGSQYAYWSYIGIGNNYSGPNEKLVLDKTRVGGKPSNSYDRYWWLRSPEPDSSGVSYLWAAIYGHGGFPSSSGVMPTSYYSFVPFFAL